VTPIVELQPNKSNHENEKSLRRSARVRIQPLEFWKGDCVEYGPNDFGDGYEGVTNMSIPRYIRKADPTPYKQRKCRPNVAPKPFKQKNETTHLEGKSSAESFDDTRLRKKYDYIDGNAADIWNDTTAEFGEMSK
jgi:centromere protein C